MENLYICCGLGDCLLYCQIYDTYKDNFKYKYVLSKEFVKKYKNNAYTYCEFMLKIFNMFNVPLTITDELHYPVVEPIKILLDYSLKTNSLSKYIPVVNTDLPKEYIVINLNIRIVNLPQIDYSSIMTMVDKLIYILNTTNFKMPIVIIGHRRTYKNINGVTNFSIYDKLISNKFIDKSCNDDLLNEPNIDNLIYDINIIKNAKETFQFGFGGSLCLNAIFSNKLSAILNPENDFIHEYFSNDFFDLNKNIIFFESRNKLLNKLMTFRQNNIFYLLCHKTLTEFELPILIEKGCGVFLPKISKSFNIFDSVYTNNYKYDYSLQNINQLDKLNNIDWFDNNQCISEEIMHIINNNFKYIFITTRTQGNILQQLFSKFKGIIYYRFFGLSNNMSYKPYILNDTSENIKYIFSYTEIYNYEISLKSNNNFFNLKNSYIIPLGVPDYILKYENTYKNSNNKICFVCSKINICPYYTNVYNTFITDIGIKYSYILLGKNNINLNDKNLKDNLNDDEYYKTISECKMIYYHSKEKMHLHYHPLEAIIIGIPIIFYEDSLLNSYLFASPGKCKTINEAHLKIYRILNNDLEFINEIIFEQNKTIDRIKMINNKNIFDNLINDNINLNNNKFELITDMLKYSHDNYITSKTILEMSNYIIEISISSLLLAKTLLNNNLILKPLYINLAFLNKMNNENIYVFFRLFLNELFKLDEIVFFYDNNIIHSNLNKHLNDISDFKSLTNYFKFKTLPKYPFLKVDYVVFHTTCLVNTNFNKLKYKLNIFCRNFKCKYKIILLGNKNTLLYNTLITLKNNNKSLIDLTKNDFINFNNYCNELAIINKAKINVVIGNTDELMSSIFFSNNVIAYSDIIGDKKYNNNFIKKTTRNLESNINKFMLKLKEFELLR
jgi:hypothetical protein